MSTTGTQTVVWINGFALREIRVRTGVEINALAQQIGRTRSYVTKIELGHSRRVGPETYARILDALGIKDRRTLLAEPFDAAGVAA